MVVACSIVHDTCGVFSLLTEQTSSVVRLHRTLTKRGFRGFVILDSWDWGGYSFPNFHQIRWGPLTNPVPRSSLARLLS